MSIGLRNKNVGWKTKKAMNNFFAVYMVSDTIFCFQELAFGLDPISLDSLSPSSLCTFLMHIFAPSQCLRCPYVGEDPRQEQRTPDGDGQAFCTVQAVFHTQD